MRAPSRDRNTFVQSDAENQRGPVQGTYYVVQHIEAKQPFAVREHRKPHPRVTLLEQYRALWVQDFDRGFEDNDEGNVHWIPSEVVSHIFLVVVDARAV